MRRLVPSLLALALAACSPIADVVAYANGTEEAGSSAPQIPTSVPTPSPTTTGSPGVACSSSSSIALRTLDGRIAIAQGRASPPRLLPLVPECTFPGGGPIAPSASGGIWATYAGKTYVVDPSGACKPLALALDASAMTFVVDPRSGAEVLYAIVEGMLVVVDPVTLARTPVGKLAVPEPIAGLAGTIDGRLFGVAGRMKPILYGIRLGDATVETTVGVAVSQPVDEPVLGLGVLAEGPAIVTEGGILWVDPKVTLAERAPHALSNVVSAGASPCALLGI